MNLIWKCILNFIYNDGNSCSQWHIVQRSTYSICLGNMRTLHAEQSERSDCSSFLHPGCCALALMKHTKLVLFALFDKNKCKVVLWGSHCMGFCTVTCVKSSFIVRVSHWGMSSRLVLAFRERTELFAAVHGQVGLVAEHGLLTGNWRVRHICTDSWAEALREKAKQVYCQRWKEHIHVPQKSETRTQPKGQQGRKRATLGSAMEVYMSMRQSLWATAGAG